MKLSDVDIMKRVQDGDIALFNELVLRYRAPLLRVAHSKLGHAAWAEDLVQEAFLAAFAARHTFDPTFAFRTWMWTILLNLCRRQLKRSAKRPQEISQSALANGPDDVLAQLAIHESGLTQALLAERQERVAFCLAELPEVQADALRLRFYGGLKFDEIARTMNCSLNGAKRRVKHGLLTLAQQLREDENEDENEEPAS